MRQNNKRFQDVFTERNICFSFNQSSYFVFLLKNCDFKSLHNQLINFRDINSFSKYLLSKYFCKFTLVFLKSMNIEIQLFFFRVKKISQF